MDNLKDIHDFLTEKKVTVKRRYTESHPAKNVSTSARVRSSIIEAIADGHITEEEMTKILTPVISKNGTIDTGAYNKALLKLSYEYYLQVEQFVYFAMTNSNTGNFLIIKPDGFNKLVDDGTVKYSPPSWGSNSGTQGGYFAIALDRMSK